jgi:cellulose synthase/poly-beta-1,6-N-acetylglucosamine synthase-like glycosyltransferase
VNAHLSDIATLALVRFELAILVYFVVVNSFYLVQLASAAFAMREHRLKAWKEARWRVLGSDVAPRISVLAPAFNEASTVAESVRALLTLHYHNLELVVINDGSKDDTIGVLVRTFDLQPVFPAFDARIAHKPVRGIYRSKEFPRLVVVDKENGGKADALNAGLNIASGDLVCAIDADTIIEPDSLQRMLRPFLLRGDVVAAGGTIRIANGCTIEQGRVTEVRAPLRPLAGFQVVEYLRAFLFGRLGWNKLGGNLIISGAFGLFNRSAVLAVGGYLHGTVGEDMELVVRLRRHGYETGSATRVDFIPDPVAWTEAPETARVLGRQRDRWHRGLAEVLWKHRKLMFNPRYGAMGMVVYPFFVFVELLAPVVEALGVLGLIAGLIIGAVNIPFAIAFFFAAYGLGMVLSLYTLVLEEVSFHRYGRFGDRLILIVWAVFENLGYRQLTVIWRLRGLLKYFQKKSDWGAMERRGFQKKPGA